MKAINIKINHLNAPLGLQVSQPLVSWNCDEGEKQTAYEYAIHVNDEKKYQSGKILSSRMSFTCPFPFYEKERVKVEISLWDEHDVQGEVSATCFEMGLKSWKAEWIDPELTESKERKPASYLKREFELKETGLARLYITCHGLYQACINGKRVGDFVLAPGTGYYNKRLQYQVYDVSDLLVQGKNIIEAVLGDGWYRGNNGIDGNQNVFGSDIALLCQLEVDGKAVMISDENWIASQNGPIRLNDLEIGETYDAGMEEVNYWHEVKVRNYGYDNLVCSDEVIIKEQEVFNGERINTPDGAIVYDFRQNLAGYTCFELNAHAGQKLTIWHGEALDKDGNFTQKNIDPGDRNRHGGIPQKVEYICKEGRNVYKPTFSIFGFQYIKVETDADLTDAVFKAIAVYSDMAETAQFNCSNNDVNKLFINSMWSMKSNFTDIPTDCPHRERSGWTGDAGVFVSTGAILHDSYTVFRKWLGECRLTQKEDGKVLNISPPIYSGRGGFSSFIEGSTGWGDAVLIVPYVLYKAYDDPTILEENYEMMKKWVGFLSELAKKKKLKTRLSRDPYKDYIIEKGFHWGEWCQPDVDSGTELRNTMTKGAPKSATAYYFYSSHLLSVIAGILGNKEDEKKYNDLAEKIRKAYIATFTDDGLVHSDRQCDYVRPLQFDLIDRKKENAAMLNEMIIKNGYHLNTGFLSTPFLCPILCEYGYVDTAYKLLLQDTCPSWLYSVKLGATSIWENWNGLESDGNGSLNHYSYGAVSGWLVTGVCGINIQNGKLVIKPCPNRQLEYASACYDSPIGRIESGWKYENDEIVYSFSIPANVTAEVILGEEKTELEYGKYEIRREV